MVRALACLVFFLAGPAAAQSRLLVGRVINASATPPQPIDKARVKLVDTNQEAVTERGRFQFALPAALIAGSELEIEFQAGNLRIYLPRNGVLTIPAPGARLVEIQLLPAGSKLFLEPAAIEALLARAAKPSATEQRRDAGQPPQREPRLQRFLLEWAAGYGFSLEDVEREVKSWGEQVRANREKASVRQRALAEFEARNFDEAAALFEESASSEAAALERIERERKAKELEERTVLRRFLDDKMRAAEALGQNFKYVEAARVLEGASKRVDRGRYAEWWAEMRRYWAEALYTAGISGEASQGIASLHASITAYQDALLVYTKESIPQDWAGTQIDLGVAHDTLGDRLGPRDAMGNIRSAVTAYQNALQVFTRDARPRDWALAQLDLGNAYRDLARLSGPEAEELRLTSVTTLQNALQIYTKESFPGSWARTQLSLGVTYQSLANSLSGPKAIDDLRAAVAAYQNALEVWTRQSQPDGWAGVQNHLGEAYWTLGERVGGTGAMENLRAAISTHRNALLVQTKETLPQDWARTQDFLGLAYGSLGSRLSGTEAIENLRAAVSAHENALQVYTKESLPQDWARVQETLGVTYSKLGFGLTGAKSLENMRLSVKAHQNALQIYTESQPSAWAWTQANLGLVYAGLGVRLSGEEAVENFRAAVSAYQNALQFYTREASAQDWARIQADLGNACRYLGQRLSGREGAESLNDAVAAYQNAFRIFTKESSPQYWARTQNYLADALYLQGKFEEAAEATANVLAVEPKSVGALARADSIYHDHLFRFDRAFDLSARRVELGDGELDFIESHLTTGRFDACAARAAAFQDRIPQKSLRPGLTALRFACLAGGQNNEDALAAGRELRKQVAGLEKTGWTFTGTKHFVSQHAAFAAHARDWVRLFEALEQGDQAKAIAALAALGVPE